VLNEVVLGLLARNVPAALVAFGIVYYSRRKQRGVELTWGRGVAVVFLGWLGGSVLSFGLFVLFELGGIAVTSQLETTVAVCMVASVVYPLFTWLCVKRGGAAVRGPTAPSP
jgi:hypothetical protein